MRPCNDQSPHHFHIVDKADMSRSANQIVNIPKNKQKTYCSGMQKLTLSLTISPL